MKTLTVEQISAAAAVNAQLAATAKAGAHLASMCRGAILGCTEKNDPGGMVADMLLQFLVLAGFEP